jgi:hypothetical protein
MDMFRIPAGLSSTTMPSDRKKAFYGLAFVATERVLARVGADGLHALCQRAASEELDEIPAEGLLEAADLTPDRGVWQRAVADALGPPELAELVRMHPHFLAQTVADFLRAYLEPSALETALPWIEARLSIAGSPASLSLWSLPEVRREVTSTFSEAARDALASR